LWHSLAREYWYENQAQADLSAQLSELDSSIDEAVYTNPGVACAFFGSHCKANACTQLGNAVDVSASPREVLHYVKEKSFTNHVLKECVISDSYIDASDEARPELDYLIGEFRQGRVTSAFLASKGAKLSSDGGYFWVTRAQEVDSRVVGLAGSERAKRIREITGLAAVFAARDEKARSLVEIRIPVHILPDLSVPTTFDAKGTTYFRPAFRKDKWGETIDLHNLSAGVPEAIHEEMVWRKEFGDPEPVGDLPDAPRVLSDAECTWLLKRSEDMLMKQWKKNVFPRQQAANP